MGAGHRISHPRARVWQEERHPYLPNWLVRPAYRILIAPIRVQAVFRGVVAEDGMFYDEYFELR